MNHGRSSLWTAVFFIALGLAGLSSLINLPALASFSQAKLFAPEAEAAPTPLESPTPKLETKVEAGGPSTPAPAASVIDKEPPVRFSAELAAHIDRILRKPHHRRAFWGVEVYSIEDNEIVYAFNSRSSFSPASNVKVFTTAAALDRLGPGFRFKTRLGYEGTLSEDGTLYGDLVLFGGGDPNLADNMYENPNQFVYLDLMARKAYQAGIRVIEGDVIGDDSYFPYEPYGDGWRLTDLGQYYGAAISALSFSNNLLGISARPARKIGPPARVYFDPPNSMLKVVNLSRTVSSRSRNTFHSYHAPGSNRVVVSGRIPITSRGWVGYITVDDPAHYTVAGFRDRLIRAGVFVKGNARSRHYGEVALRGAAQDIYVHESAPLTEIIAYINKKSQNLYAEILLRTLGAEVKGSGTDTAGLRVLSEFLREAGVNDGAVELQDGSGLSRFNLITPRAETMFLAHLSTKPYFPMFMESLSVAGRDGTLKNRMRRTPAEQRVFAKTGTLSQVATLGGYVKTRSDKTLAFSILINNFQFSPFTARRAMDEICALLARY